MITFTPMPERKRTSCFDPMPIDIGPIYTGPNPCNEVIIGSYEIPNIPHFPLADRIEELVTNGLGYHSRRGELSMLLNEAPIDIEEFYDYLRALESGTKCFLVR